MKKTLIIALSCLIVLLAACNKQNPNEKFIGDYSGSGIVNGTISFDYGTTHVDQDIADMAIPMAINLAAGEAKNEVIMTYTNEDVEETYTAKGIVSDYDVAFDPITIRQIIDGTYVNLTLNLEGTLLEKEGILKLNGDIKGNGNMINLGDIPFTVTGTVTANLNKGAAPNPNTPAADPTLTLVTGEGFLSEGDEIEMGKSVTLGLTCKAEALKALKVEYFSKGTLIAEDKVEYDGVNTSDEYTSTFTLSQDLYPLLQEGYFSITATLTDTHNKTAVLSLSIKVLPAPTPNWEAHYQGTVTLNATASATIYSYPIETESDMEINLADSDEEGIVSATVRYGEAIYSTTGTKEGNVIDFEPFDIMLSIEGSSVTVSLDMVGTIGESVLSVEGNVSGNGNITLPDIPFSIPTTIEGTIAGVLNEVR